ncbi:MAG: PorT family protein [Prevotellaceae bacterium]|jgi:hypothetical protein|nr:PorT family protein [Prevotellaceae bacterium]
MKTKIMVVSLFVLMTAGAVHAQNVRFGIRGGLNFASLNEYEIPVATREEAEMDERLGLYAGAFVQVDLSEKVGLETGLFYTQLGGRDKEDDYGEQYEVKANPSYLQLPVSIFYKFTVKQLTLYPSVGLYAGYGLSGKMKGSGSVTNRDETVTQIDFDDDYFDTFARKFDIGGTIGIHAAYSKFILSLTYDRGFVRVNKEKPLYGGNAFNSNVRLGLGFVF